MSIGTNAFQAFAWYLETEFCKLWLVLCRWVTNDQPSYEWIEMLIFTALIGEWKTELVVWLIRMTALNILWIHHSFSLQSRLPFSPPPSDWPCLWLTDVCLWHNIQHSGFVMHWGRIAITADMTYLLDLVGGRWRCFFMSSWSYLTKIYMIDESSH